MLLNCITVRKRMTRLLRSICWTKTLCLARSTDEESKRSVCETDRCTQGCVYY